MTLGQKIKQLRKKNKLSMEKLSMLSGVDIGTISRMESGERKTLTLPTAMRLADAFGVTMDELTHLTINK